MDLHESFMSEPTNGQSGQSTNSTKMCTRLGLLNVRQINVVVRHLDEHKWYKGIPPERAALAAGDFNKEYGWILRDMICGHICDEGRGNVCEAYSNYLNDHKWQRSHAKNVVSRARMIQALENKASLPYCPHLADFLDKFEPIILAHLDEHVYFSGKDRKQAESDFVERFGWAAREIYCDAICPDNQKCDNYKKYLERFVINKEW
jgi:hypothetical protein